MKFGHLEGEGCPQTSKLSIIHGLLSSLLLPPSFPPPKTLPSSLGWVCWCPSVMSHNCSRRWARKFLHPSEIWGFFWWIFFFGSRAVGQRIFFLAFFETSFLETLLFWSVRTSWNPTRVNEPLFRSGVLLDPQNDATFEGISEGSNFYFPPRKIQQCLQFTRIY